MPVLTPDPVRFRRAPCLIRQSSGARSWLFWTFDTKGSRLLALIAAAILRRSVSKTPIAQSPSGAADTRIGATLELKDRKIRVSSMSPGPIDTPALATTTGLTPEQAEQAAAQFASQIPMGRRGEQEEIAATVTFLASDESSFVTGVDLAVDGGLAQV
jgi:Enoyl-(Acyl carrier protein) reductase